MDDANKVSIFNELTNVARPNVSDSSKPTPGRKSKFWFRLGGPTQEEQRQASFDRPLPVPVDQEIVNRAQKYQKTLPKQLEGQIKVVREFFLQEIAPLLVAGSTGVLQAKDVMSKAIGSEVDDTSEFFFNQMMTKAVNLKLCKFVSNFFSLDAAEAEYLLNQLSYRRTLTLEAPEPAHPISEDTEFRVAPSKPKVKRSKEKQHG